MRILFAGIIARYPFGGVTWCSLMYLLGLRALGHEVFYIEDTGECVYDYAQNVRSTDPTYGTHLHPARPRAVRVGQPMGVRQLRRQLPWGVRGRRAAVCGGCRPVHQPLRRLVVLARRVRAHPAQGLHRFRSRVHAARDREGRRAVRRVFSAVRSPLHLRREHRHAGVGRADRSVHVAQDVAAHHHRRLAPAARTAAIGSPRS